MEVTDMDSEIEAQIDSDLLANDSFQKMFQGFYFNLDEEI